MRAARTVDGDAQRRVLASLFTRFTADRDALASAIRRCEERLDALARGERLPIDGTSASDDERFRQLEQSVLDATRDARRAIEVARQSLDGAPAAERPRGSVEALQSAVTALERRMTTMENEADARLQTAVTRIAETVAELDDRIARALEQSGRSAEVLSDPATADGAPSFAWIREELDARIEATVSAVKDLRAQLSTRMADVTQRGDEVLDRLGALDARQEALEGGITGIEARMADVADRLRALGDRLSQVAAIAGQDRQQVILARLHTRLDVLEASLRRIAPEALWSVSDSVARALEPVMPAFLTDWLRSERR
jgi:chromosome segregation ATPase